MGLVAPWHLGSKFLGQEHCLQGRYFPTGPPGQSQSFSSWNTFFTCLPRHPKHLYYTGTSFLSFHGYHSWFPQLLSAGVSSTQSSHSFSTYNAHLFPFFFFLFLFFFSYIEMKRPWVYMSSPSRSPLPPPSPPAPSRSSQSTRSERLSHASNLGWWSVSPLIVYMFRCYSLETSHPRLLPQSLNDCRLYMQNRKRDTDLLLILSCCR